MSVDENNYKFEELIAVVEELVSYLKKKDISTKEFAKLTEKHPQFEELVSYLKKTDIIKGEFAKLTEKHPWCIQYLSMTSRVVNLMKLISFEGLRVEFVGKTTKTDGVPFRVLIRVSITDIRNQVDLHSEVFCFQEVFPDMFIYIKQ